MLKTNKVFYWPLVVGLGLFLWGCEREQPEAPNRTKNATRTVSSLESEPEIDPERARKIEALIRKLNGSDERAAYDAALQLSLIGDETAVEPLMNVYYREHGMMRVAALKALGSIGDERAMDVLLRAINDEDVNIRQNAASGLGNIGDDSATGPLIEALRDEDSWVRMNAMDSLKKITGKDFAHEDAWREWYYGR